MNEIFKGMRDYMYLGNLNSIRDWGYAPDYVKAMQLINDSSYSDDYVVATNKVHSVKDLIKIAGKEIDMNVEFEGEGVEEVGVDRRSGKIIIKVDKKYFRPADVTYLQGSFEKIHNDLNWSPETTFETMIKKMMRADFENVGQSIHVF